jgi:hypothetical protein
MAGGSKTKNKLARNGTFFARLKNPHARQEQASKKTRNKGKRTVIFIVNRIITEKNLPSPGEPPENQKNFRKLQVEGSNVIVLIFVRKDVPITQRDVNILKVKASRLPA